MLAWMSDPPAATSSSTERLTTISVVTPSLNQAAFLEQTIQSVLEQGYPSLEYLVLDAGSTDGSVPIIERYAGRLAYWHSRPDGGQGSAVNAGWARSTGDVLGWLNSDDRYLPGVLEFVGDLFRRNPEVVWLFGTAELVDVAGRRIGQFGRPFDGRRLSRGDQMIPQPSAFLRRSALEIVGPIDESLRYGMDFDLFIRLARIATPVFVDRPLSSITLHASAKTTRNRAAARQETFRVAARYASPVERALLRLLAIRAAAYHRLPASLRRRLDVARDLPVLED